MNSNMNSFVPELLVSDKALPSDPLFHPHLYYDYIAILQVGVSAGVGSAWWIIAWFVYLKSTGNDPDLILNNVNVLPI